MEQLAFAFDDIAPLCACGCRELVNKKTKTRWYTYVRSHDKRRPKPWRYDNSNAPLCSCGCGKGVVRSQTTPYNWNKYIHNHHRATKDFVKERWQEPPLCACGCGEKVSRTYRNKRWRKYISEEHQLRDPEYHKKLSKRSERYWKDPICREKMRKAQIVYWSDLVNRMEASTRAKITWADPERRLKAKLTSKRIWEDPTYRAKISESRKKSWQNPVYVTRVRDGMRKSLTNSPNLLEQDFDSMTSNKIMFVGNGALWYTLKTGKSKNPDFQIVDTNKVIELYGSYWHKNDDPQDIINRYAEIGIECMVIWEHDWYNDQVPILEQVNKFVERI